MCLAYLFETESIQKYLFATGKLRDVSGASELVSSLAFESAHEGVIAVNGLLADILEQSALSGKARLYRCAGGVIDLVCDNDKRTALSQFRALWRLSVARCAPGLAYRDGVAEADNDDAARQNARIAVLRAPPRRYPDAPPAAPIIRPATLTDAAPAFWGAATLSDGRCRITQEFADAPTLAKRQFLAQGDDRLARLFVSSKAEAFAWPVVFEVDPDRPDDPVFPFTAELKRVALVHIDGNGVGAFFAGLAGKIDDIRSVSSALAQATKDAAAQAMETVLAASMVPNGETKPVVPARPILLGGDDLTIILRADLAFGFARTFAAAFERETKARFNDIAGLETSEGLTAKAGIVFMGPRQPFVQAYELCEDLANAARPEASPGKSRVAFWRLTGAMIPQSVDEIEALTERNNLSFWRRSWRWDEFADLEALAELLRDDQIGRGALRRLPEMALSDDTGATETLDDVYRRAIHVLKNRAPDTAKSFYAHMQKIGVADPDTDFAADGYVPLLDALVLRKIMEASGP